MPNYISPIQRIVAIEGEKGLFTAKYGGTLLRFDQIDGWNNRTGTAEAGEHSQFTTRNGKTLALSFKSPIRTRYFDHGRGVSQNVIEGRESAIYLRGTVWKSTLGVVHGSAILDGSILLHIRKMGRGFGWRLYSLDLDDPDAVWILDDTFTDRHDHGEVSASGSTYDYLFNGNSWCFSEDGRNAIQIAEFAQTQTSPRPLQFEIHRIQIVGNASGSLSVNFTHQLAHSFNKTVYSRTEKTEADPGAGTQETFTSETTVTENHAVTFAADFDGTTEQLLTSTWVRTEQFNSDGDEHTSASSSSTITETDEIKLGTNLIFSGSYSRTVSGTRTGDGDPATSKAEDTGQATASESDQRIYLKALDLRRGGFFVAHQNQNSRDITTTQTGEKNQDGSAVITQDKAETIAGKFLIHDGSQTPIEFDTTQPRTITPDNFSGIPNDTIAGPFGVTETTTETNYRTNDIAGFFSHSVEQPDPVSAMEMQRHKNGGTLMSLQTLGDVFYMYATAATWAQATGQALSTGDNHFGDLSDAVTDLVHG